MGLRVKTFNEILNSSASWIVSHSSKLSNFTIGSVIRTLLESVAIEIEAMYFQMHKGFKYAIENSIFHSFDFYKLPAEPATGQVTIVFNEALTDRLLIPIGYRFSTISIDNEGTILYFKTTENTTCESGSTMAIVNVECETAGTIGNIPAWSIRSALSPMGIFSDIYNLNAFENGKPEETKDERKKRFTLYVDTRAKGTVNALKYGCLEVDGVTGVYIDEYPGYNLVYAHDSNGSLPDAMKAEIISNLENYRSAGVEVIVLPVTKKTTDLTLNVKMDKAYNLDSYKTLIESRVTNFLNSFPVSKDLAIAELHKAIMSIDESAIIDVSTNLTSNVVCGKSDLIRSGTITVTCSYGEW